MNLAGEDDDFIILGRGVLRLTEHIEKDVVRVRIWIGLERTLRNMAVVRHDLFPRPRMRSGLVVDVQFEGMRMGVSVPTSQKPELDTVDVMRWVERRDNATNVNLQRLESYCYYVLPFKSFKQLKFK